MSSAAVKAASMCECVCVRVCVCLRMCVFVPEKRENIRREELPRSKFIYIYIFITTIIIIIINNNNITKQPSPLYTI